MWENILGRLPSGMIFISAILSVVIPLSIYYVNQRLHKYGDPPWKKKEDR
jgi:hypothetical protein